MPFPSARPGWRRVDPPPADADRGAAGLALPKCCSRSISKATGRGGRWHRTWQHSDEHHSSNTARRYASGEGRLARQRKATTAGARPAVTTIFRRVPISVASCCGIGRRGHVSDLSLRCGMAAGPDAVRGSLP